jgi:hypothetical protein
MAVRCEGCDRHAGKTVCHLCKALLCARCFGPFSGGVCEACLGGYQPELPQHGPCVEDVVVRGGII